MYVAREKQEEILRKMIEKLTEVETSREKNKC